jgi:hypothetical protein
VWNKTPGSTPVSEPHSARSLNAPRRGKVRVDHRRKGPSVVAPFDDENKVSDYARELDPSTQKLYAHILGVCREVALERRPEAGTIASLSRDDVAEVTRRLTTERRRKRKNFGKPLNWASQASKVSTFAKALRKAGNPEADFAETKAEVALRRSRAEKASKKPQPIPDILTAALIKEMAAAVPENMTDEQLGVYAYVVLNRHGLCEGEIDDQFYIDQDGRRVLSGHYLRVRDVMLAKGQIMVNDPARGKEQYRWLNAFWKAELESMLGAVRRWKAACAERGDLMKDDGAIICRREFDPSAGAFVVSPVGPPLWKNQKCWLRRLLAPRLANAQCDECGVVHPGAPAPAVCGAKDASGKPCASTTFTPGKYPLKGFRKAHVHDAKRIFPKDSDQRKTISGWHVRGVETEHYDPTDFPEVFRTANAIASTIKRSDEVKAAEQARAEVQAIMRKGREMLTVPIGDVPGSGLGVTDPVPSWARNQGSYAAYVGAGADDGAVMAGAKNDIYTHRSPRGSNIARSKNHA